MKSKLYFAVSALALIGCVVSIALFMEMYDLKPQTWGPQGVEFVYWHGAWTARRDFYALAGAGSFSASVVFCLAGMVKRGRRITKPCS